MKKITILLFLFLNVFTYAQDEIERKEVHYYIDGQLLALPNQSNIISLDYGYLFNEKKSGLGLSFTDENYQFLDNRYQSTNHSLDRSEYLNYYSYENAFTFEVSPMLLIFANQVQISMGYHIRPNLGFGVSAMWQLSLVQNQLYQFGLGAYYSWISSKYYLRAEVGNVMNAKFEQRDIQYIARPEHEFLNKFSPYGKVILAKRFLKTWMVGFSYTYSLPMFEEQRFDDYGKRIAIEDRNLSLHFPMFYVGRIISSKVSK